MKNPPVKICWYCKTPFAYERKTAHYCSDVCRVKDHKLKKEEVEFEIFKLELKQRTDRINESVKIYIKLRDEGKI